MSGELTGISEENLMALLAAWDKVSVAIDCIVVCQPAGMTAASENLEAQRKRMRAIINIVTRPSRTALQEANRGE